MLDHAGDDQRLVPPLRQNRLSRAVALSIGLSLVACSSEKADRPSQSAASEFTSVQGRIRLLGEDSASLAAFEKTKTQYETATGISVEIVRRDHADVIADLHGATAAPAYDLLIVPSYLLGELVESEYVQPIDIFLGDRSLFDPRLFDPEKDVVPGWWSQLSWYHGHPYGYPFQLRPMSLWYREDLFEDEDESVAFEKQFGRPLTFPHSASELEQVASFFHRPQEGLYGTVVARPEHVAGIGMADLRRDVRRQNSRCAERRRIR